jgi:hypothetical protein
VAALAASNAGAQCRGSDQVSFEIDLPSALSTKAQWMEVGVFNGTCPSATQLAGGIPRSGTLTRIAFPKGDTSPPLVGDLSKAPYAFAAVARDANCAVLATGCSVVDLGKAKDVTIHLSATAHATGACASGETCAEAECVPALGPGNPTLGGHCTMELVGAGPLGDPLVLNGGDVVSAPAIVGTEHGFLIAYREYDANAGSARLTVAAVDNGGGMMLAPPTMLPAQCSGQVETDGVGLAYLAGSGVVVSARPSCGGQPGGLDAFALDAGGSVGGTAFNGALGPSPTLSRAHALSLAGSTSGWVALLDQSSAQLVGLSGLSTQGGPTAFGGPPPQTLAQVVATDQMLALLTAGSPPSLVDSGAPSDAAASSDATVPPDAATGPSTLQLLLGTSGADAGAPLVIPGSWGALAAEAGRAFVLSDPADGSSTTIWTAADLGSAAPSATGTFAPPGQGQVLGADVAFHADRLMLAAEQPGSIALAVYDHASTTPTPLRTLLLSDDPRVPPQKTVQDGRVVVAASDSRVAVAWITAATLGSSDAVGGYALYACSP